MKRIFGNFAGFAVFSKTAPQAYSMTLCLSIGKQYWLSILWDTVGEFKFQAHSDVDTKLKLNVGNEFANGIRKDAEPQYFS